MTSFIAKKALLPEGFADNVYIEHDEGVIIEVRPQDNTEGVNVLDKIVLPALPNLHSHAF